MFGILAHASNYTSPTPGMRYAADVAKQFASPLTCVFVSEPIVPVPSMGFTPVVSPLYTVAAEITNEAQAFAPKFNAWATSIGLSSYQWQVATGFLSGALAAAACWHDALVIESGNKIAWNSVGILGQVIVGCGIPCFVVPETFEKPARFDTIAIASHGSPESIRALHAALPLLQRAKRIVLMKGSPRDTFSAAEFKPAFTIEDHLSTHGLQFVTRTLQAADERIGAEILATAQEVAADVLVMGAYGRTRFSEWVLGGATRYVLENAKLPLFMRH